MARKYPEGFYVYIHIRNDNGKVFYVGRGKEYRAWAKTGRNKHWTNVFKKCGLSVEIVESGLSLEESNLLEKMVIEMAVFCGCRLANRTSGGDGCSGFEFEDASRIKMSRSHGGKRVFCSNGMVFDTGQKAADWLNENGNPLALSGHVSACARGVRGSAYGYSWWYEGDDPKCYIPRYERLSITSSKGVSCSNGMIFRNTKKAEEWLKTQGFQKAHRSGIESAIRGDVLIAYGFTWWLTGGKPVSIEHQMFRKMMLSGRKIIMDGILSFFSLDCAIDFLKKEGHSKVSKSCLTVCAQGKTKTAYGHKWEYVHERH